jgi:hypothetical protein
VNAREARRRAQGFSTASSCTALGFLARARPSSARRVSLRPARARAADRRELETRARKPGSARARALPLRRLPAVGLSCCNRRGLAMPARPSGFAPRSAWARHAHALRFFFGDSTAATGRGPSRSRRVSLRSGGEHRARNPDGARQAAPRELYQASPAADPKPGPGLTQLPRRADRPGWAR